MMNTRLQSILRFRERPSQHLHLEMGVGRNVLVDFRNVSELPSVRRPFAKTVDDRYVQVRILLRSLFS